MLEQEFDKYKSMEPMKYYDNPLPKTQGAINKRQSIICGELSKDYIGTVKFDGDWAMFIHYEKGKNLIRSRSISKVTGEYGNYTEKLPALVAEMDKWPDQSVILGEICLSGKDQNANTIGTILRCLPTKAIERQKTTPVEVHIFDILCWSGIETMGKSYELRLELIKTLKEFIQPFYLPIIYKDSFNVYADEVISNGGEGLVLQRKDNPYMPGTRTAWKTLKLKQALPHMDLKVVDVLEPNKLYEGDNISNWPYWSQDMKNANSQSGDCPVTKPYFMGWKNGIVVDYNGVRVNVASGLTDDDRAWLATNDAKEQIASGNLYAEIKAMSENSQGSLRHPCLVRLRPREDM